MNQLHQPIAAFAEQPPYLMRAIKLLAKHPHQSDDVTQLVHDLTNITVMVADKFTNNRTAEGIQEALRLTVGCLSLGLGHANLHDDDKAALNLLIEHGAEYVFQQGFRLVRELAQLPEATLVSDYDQTPYEQERRLKSTFRRLCDADPNAHWLGVKDFQRELDNRKRIATTIECAQWLRKHHHDGAVKEEDMDADGVLAVAIIFATQGRDEIVARAGQKKLEGLIETLRKNQPDFEQSWAAFLNKIPKQFQPLMQERISAIKTSAMITLMQKAITSKPTKAAFTKLLKELQNHGGSEVDIDYA